MKSAYRFNKGKSLFLVQSFLQIFLYLLPIFYIYDKSNAESILEFIIGFYIVYKILKKTPPFFERSIHVPVLIFMLLVVFTSIINIGLFQTWKEGKIFYYGIGLFIVLVDLIRENRKILNRLCLVLLLLSLFLGVDVLWQQFQGVDLFSQAPIDNRATALFSHPNYLALFLVGVIPIQAYFIITRETWVRVSNIVLFVLTIIAVGLSKCRSAWIALVFFLVALSFRKRKDAAIILVLFCLCAAVFISLYHTEAYERLTHFMSDEELRVNHWSQSLKLIQANPILGQGLDTFKSLYPQYNFTSEIVSGPHNFFLEVWQIAGLFALIVYLFLLYKMVSFGLAAQRGNTMVFSLLMSFFMVFIATVINIPFFSRYVSFSFWFYFGLMMGARESYFVEGHKKVA